MTTGKLLKYHNKYITLIKPSCHCKYVTKERPNYFSYVVENAHKRPRCYVINPFLFGLPNIFNVFLMNIATNLKFKVIENKKVMKN